MSQVVRTFRGVDRIADVLTEVLPQIIAKAKAGDKQALDRLAAIAHIVLGVGSGHAVAEQEPQGPQA